MYKVVDYVRESETLRPRKKERKNYSVSVCAYVCVCARASEWTGYLSACVCPFHSYVSSESEYRHKCNSLPYAQKTYKSQHKHWLGSLSAMHVRFMCWNKYPCISPQSCMELSTLTKIKSNMSLSINVMMMMIIIITVVISNFLLWRLPTICAVNVDI